MPRYFFHTQNDETVRDENGHELPDSNAAKAEAVAMMGEMLRDRARDFWASGRLRVTVEGGGGDTVVVLTTRVEEAPN